MLGNWIEVAHRYMLWKTTIIGAATSTRLVSTLSPIPPPSPPPPFPRLRFVTSTAPLARPRWSTPSFSMSSLSLYSPLVPMSLSVVVVVRSVIIIDTNKSRSPSTKEASAAASVLWLRQKQRLLAANSSASVSTRAFHSATVRVVR